MTDPPATPPRPAEVLKKPRGESHLPALDGLRGLAVLLVVLHHIMPARGPANLLERVVFRTAGTGWIGVDLFFVLSGFLITGILLSAKYGPRYFTNFYMRRTLRIFPLYLGVLFAIFFIAPFLPIPWPRGMDDVKHHQLWFWLYATNFMVPFNLPMGLLGHFWTLAIEEQFYLVWPLLVLVLSPRKLIVLCLGMVVAALGFRIGLAVHTTHLDGLQADGMAMSVFKLTFCRMDTLAVGGLLAILSQAPPFDLLKLARCVFYSTGLAIVGLVAWRTWSFDPSEAYPVSWLNHYDLIVTTAGLTVIAFFAASLLVFCFEQQAHTRINRIFRLPILRTLGKYSYGIYVFHYPIVYVALTDQRFLGLKIENAFHHGLVAMSVRFVVLLGLSFALAFVSFHLYEKQFLRLKRYFEYRHPSAPQSTPTGESIDAIDGRPASVAG